MKLTNEQQSILAAEILGAKWYLFDSGYSWLSFKDLTLDIANQCSRWKAIDAPEDPGKIVIGDTVPAFHRDANASLQLVEWMGKNGQPVEIKRTSAATVQDKFRYYCLCYHDGKRFDCYSATLPLAVLGAFLRANGKEVK